MKKLFSKNFVKYSCISRVFKKTLYNSFTRVLVKLKFWFHEIYICIQFAVCIFGRKTRENSNMREKKTYKRCYSYNSATTLSSYEEQNEVVCQLLIK